MVAPDDDVISMSGRSAINHYQKFNIVQPPAAPTPPIKQNQIQEQLAFDLSKIVFSADQNHSRKSDSLFIEKTKAP